MKKNMQFRFQIYDLLHEYVQLNSGEINDFMIENNPKSCPPFNRVCQLMRCKWFINLGITTSRKNGALRHAIWELNDEYREYPPMRHPKSSRVFHMGGKKEYDEVIE